MFKKLGQSTAMPFLILVLAMTLTGANVPIGKVVVEDLPVLVFVAVRFLVASSALALIASAEDWRQIRSSARSNAATITGLALFGSILFMIFLLEGTKRTTATSAGLITATLPAVVALLAIVVLRQRVSLPALTCIGLAVVGLALMQVDTAQGSSTLQRAEYGAQVWLGNAFVLAAVFCEASFVLLSPRAAARLSPVALSFLVSIVGLAVALPASITAVTIQGFPSVSGEVWLLTIWYALAASVFTTVLWYHAAARTPSWQAGLATTAVPITAVAIGVGVLGEGLGLWQGVGGALILIAMGLAAVVANGESYSARTAHTDDNAPQSDGEA